MGSFLTKQTHIDQPTCMERKRMKNLNKNNESNAKIKAYIRAMLKKNNLKYTSLITSNEGNDRK